MYSKFLLKRLDSKRFWSDPENLTYKVPKLYLAPIVVV